MPVKTVFFDLDGTLWDSRACSAYVMGTAIKRLRQRGEKFEIPCHKVTSLNIALLDAVIEGGLQQLSYAAYKKRFDKFLERCGIASDVTARELSSHCHAARRLAIRAFIRDDAHETLIKLKNKGVGVGVLTNGTPAAKRQVIDSLGLRDILDYTILAEAEGLVKPDVRLFRRCIEIAGSQPSETLFVGDSFFTDLLGAKRAEAKAVLLCREKMRIPARIPPPDYALTGLKSILKII